MTGNQGPGASRATGLQWNSPSLYPPSPPHPAHCSPPCALFNEWLWHSSRCWSQKSWRLSAPPSCLSPHQSPTSHWPFLRSSVQSPSATQMPSYPCSFLVSCRLCCCPLASFHSSTRVSFMNCASDRSVECFFCLCISSWLSHNFGSHEALTWQAPL